MASTTQTCVIRGRATGRDGAPRTVLTPWGTGLPDNYQPLTPCSTGTVQLCHLWSQGEVSLGPRLPTRHPYFSALENRSL